MFSEEKQKFQTLKEVEFELDQKYAKAEESENKEDFEILKEIDSYTQQVRKNYEVA